jgi:hypothetical protein
MIIACEFEDVLENISFPNLQQLTVYEDCPTFNVMASSYRKN